MALFAATAFLSSSPCSLAFDHTHGAFSRELARFVDESGGVAYSRWRRATEGLDEYLEQLSKITPQEYAGFSDSERKALWINAYNALAIRLVLDRYPLAGSNPGYPSSSIRQIPEVWEAIRRRVAGRDVDLYFIEHQVLRRELNDCRHHFAVCPASRGGAQLKRTALQAPSVDEQLAAAAREFMSDSKHVSPDSKSGTLRVSQIFKWFPLDFNQSERPALLSDDEIVRRYVLPKLPESALGKRQIDDWKVEYMPYDWTLNDAR